MKRLLWEELDEITQCIPQIEKLFNEGDFNGRIRRNGDCYEMIHRGFSHVDRNSGGCYFGLCNDIQASVNS